jgi:hypothetical protein
MNKSETIKLFSLITNAYDMFDVTEEKVELWSGMLEDQEFNNVLGNLKNHIQREKYPPSIADLRGVLAYTANDGYKNKDEVLRIEGMKQEALKRIPEELIPEFIKRARERA